MKLYDKVIRICGTTDFMKGLNYQSNKIKLIKSEKENIVKRNYFKIISERVDKEYDVEVITDQNKNINDYFCTCPQYEKMDTCKHIAACILKYETEIFDEKEYKDTNYKYTLGLSILEKFNQKKPTIKEKLKLEVEIKKIESYYYTNYITVIYKIGLDKMYTLNNKYHNFMYAYHHKQDYKISTKLTYSPDKYYFDKIDEKILNFNIPIYQKGLYTCVITSENLESFMELIKDKQIKMDNQTIKYIKENPFDINLTKTNNYYKLSINNLNKINELIDNSPFFYDEKAIYKVDENIYKLYKLLKENNIDSFIFEKKDLGKFTSGLLPLLKENIKLDEKITEITISSTPDVKLYFDFNYNCIECKIKLTYSNKEIDYFSKDPTIVRDYDYENNIIQNLTNQGFTVENKKIKLEDIDQIGTFLETEIYQINEEYEIYTSKQIKETKLIKQTSNSVTFKIGKDNILSYNFNLDGIENSDLTNILTSLKSRKHYHKLKNGNIINLETDENLKQLNKVIDELGLTNKEIETNEGTIPKFRVLYLDSIKTKYDKLIETNNTFDAFIKKFKTYKNQDINLSKDELKILRDYQLTGVKWLYNIYKSGFGCILADEMGLGKSIQLIYLMKLIIKENKNAKLLIVAPTSLIYNWKKELDKFSPDLKYKVFAENKSQRLNNFENLNDINIIITSYGLIRNDIEEYKKINFNLIAIDEAQNIKNSNTGISKALKQLSSDVKMALTGTPIENSILELWSIFDFIMPGYLANKEKFQNLYSTKDMENEETIQRLKTQIKYFILRRKKKDVIKDLPDKLENNIYIELDQKQKEIYAAEVKKTKETLDEMIKKEGFTKSRFKILQLLTKLRQICITPSLVFENYKGKSSKIENLLKIIQEEKENGHKMLIFTTYKKALDLVIPQLTKMGISSYSIDGTVSSKKRMELVEKFNKDKTDVFIITLKAGGTGLNLTSATVVIHLDLWWNPQVENQATDRAHRIGQKNTVEVIRLITKGTIEERILELQNKKKKLAQLLIDNESSDQNNFSKLSEKDIKMLLSMDNDD